MLANTRITTTLPVTDIERARTFYQNALGLKEAGRGASGAVLLRTSAGSELELVPRPERTKAEHTVLSFEVQNIEDEIRDLEGRGVRFEDYDQPGLKTTRHIATMDGEKAAWFRDPEGNILCIHQGRRS